MANGRTPQAQSQKAAAAPDSALPTTALIDVPEEEEQEEISPEAVRARPDDTQRQATEPPRFPRNFEKVSTDLGRRLDKAEALLSTLEEEGPASRADEEDIFDMKSLIQEAKSDKALAEKQVQDKESREAMINALGKLAAGVTGLVSLQDRKSSGLNLSNLQFGSTDIQRELDRVQKTYQSELANIRAQAADRLEAGREQRLARTGDRRAEIEAAQLQLNRDKERRRALESALKSAEVPAGTKKELRKEKANLEEHNRVIQDALATFDQAGEIGGVAGTLPSILGGKRGELGAFKAKIAGLIVGKVPGIRSDKDFDRVITPMLPSQFDPERTVQAKRDSFAAWLNSQKPATPALDTIVGPAQQSQPQQPRAGVMTDSQRKRLEELRARRGSQ